MNKQRLRDLFDMNGRVVVVTGDTRGIGRALAEGYRHAGAKAVRGWLPQLQVVPDLWAIQSSPVRPHQSRGR
jgi:hypothetical protein